MGALTSERTRASVPKHWLPLSHAEALRSLDGVELVGLCDVSAERAEEAAESFGLSESFTDADQMLAACKPDIVGIATRTAERADLIMRCLKQGVRGIHAEKPLALSMKATENLLREVNTHGAALTLGTVRRFMPSYRKALERVRAGAIGEVRQVAVEHNQDLLFWGHPHAFDLIMLFLGSTDIANVRTVPVNACERTASENVLEDDPVVSLVTLTLRDGRSGIITEGPGCNLRVYGSEGVLTVYNDGESLEIRTRDPRAYLSDPQSISVNEADTPSGTAGAFQSLRNQLQGKAAPMQTLVEIRAVQQALMMAAWSVSEGGSIVTPEAVPHDFHALARFRGNFA